MVLRLGRTLNMKPTHAANFSANMKTSLSKPTKITTAKNNIPVTSGSAISRYRGIRWRGGKWVTEIRVPKKNKRLWLGTYLTPEMAATAYDVAALALKGEEAVVNFPGAVRSYPLPCSNSETHIRKAASVAAAAVAPVVVATAAAVVATNTVVATATNKVKENEKNEEGVCDVVGHLTTKFVDEEELFNMPNLLVDMARAMMLDPPPMGSPRLDDSLEIYIGESLWSYKL